MTRSHPMKFCDETRASGLFWEHFSQILSADSLIAPFAPKKPKGMEGMVAISFANQNCILYRLATTRIMAPTCGAFMP
jgi:hypothetical protein